MAKNRTYASWRKEIRSIIIGMPVCEAASLIERNAKFSRAAGELNARGLKSAMDWAFSVSRRRGRVYA